MNTLPRAESSDSRTKVEEESVAKGIGLWLRLTGLRCAWNQSLMRDSAGAWIAQLRVHHEGTLDPDTDVALIVFCEDRFHYQVRLDSRIKQFCSALGCRVARVDFDESDYRPGEHRSRAFVHLARKRTDEWLPTVTEATRLLEECVRLASDPAVWHTRWYRELDVEVKIAAEPKPDPGMAWRDSLKREWTELCVRVLLTPAGAAALVGQLISAQRSAPSGYVGLKHFLYRYLLPGESDDAKAALLDVASANDAIRVKTVQDPKTGVQRPALELNPDSELVKWVTGAAWRETGWTRPTL